MDLPVIYRENAHDGLMDRFSQEEFIAINVRDQRGGASSWK
jgi:hypothetical protein